ncbi:MAG: putative glycoside hydrolase, partial [Woeseiaceae bacterium]
MHGFRNGLHVNRGSSSAGALDRPARALLIGLLALLLAAAWPLQAAETATGSTKFIPTFLVHYGADPAFVAADAPMLAKFDLIDIPRSRYDDIGPNTWAAIKSINPGVQIYLYEMGPETPSHLDSTLQLHLNGLGRYNVSRGHFMGSLNGDHPELYLLDSSGNRVHSTVFSNVGAGQYWHLMDFGTATYQSYWLTAVKADIVDQPWVADGIFVDNCLTLADAGGYSGAPAMYPSNAAWSGAMNSFAEAITAGMHGYGQKLWCNRGDTRKADGSAAWLALDGSASAPDVLLEPGAFAVASGSWDVQFYPESEWKRQVDTLGAIRNSRVAMMSHTKLAEGGTGTDDWGKPVNYGQALWYSLGSFLLSKNDALGNAYFMFNGGSGHDKIWWHAEYDHIDLGTAIGPYRVTTIGSVNVYWREFERGYVYVNPTPSDVASLILPQASRQLTRDNMTSAPDSIPGVSAISLNGHSAAILLKTDAIAPSTPNGLAASALTPTSFTLSWDAATDNVGVTSSRVYRNGTLIMPMVT